MANEIFVRQSAYPLGDREIFSSGYFVDPSTIEESADTALAEMRQGAAFQATYGHFSGTESNDENLGVVLPDPVADTGELLEIMMGKTRKGKRPDKLKRRK